MALAAEGSKRLDSQEGLDRPLLAEDAGAAGEEAGSA